MMGNTSTRDKPSVSFSGKQRNMDENVISAESVASLPPPGQDPSCFVFNWANKEKLYLSFLSSSNDNRNNNEGSGDRKLCAINLTEYASKSFKKLKKDDGGVFPDVMSLLDERCILMNDKLCVNKVSSESDESLEEKLRRERKRLHSTGITSFLWNPDGESILVPLRGNLYLKSLKTETIECLYDKGILANYVPEGRDSGAIDAQFSPNGNVVSFIVHGDIFLLSTRVVEKPVQITFGGDENITHGLADFLAQEEMDRYRGYWWNPSSNGICFAKVDTNNVPNYRITHQGREINSFEDHRYPFAGEANPIVNLGYVVVLNNESTRSNFDNVTWFTPPSDAREYLARVNWLADGSICAQWQNRTQTNLVLIRYNVNTGSSLVLLRDTNDLYWINLHHMFRSFIYNSSLSFIFASERTGFSHLYLYEISNNEAICVRPLSSGPWLVESIIGLDLEHGWIYVAATYDSPLERHLYALSFIKKDQSHHPLRLTKESGMHSFVMDSACNFIVDSHSDLRRPTSLIVHSVRHTANKIPTLQCLFILHDSSSTCSSLEQLIYPELLSFPTSDGTHELHAALYLPDQKIYGTGPYPLICSVYGGPHVQRVTRSWFQTIDMRAQRLCSLGFAVAKCDNRGSSRRGLSFEGAIKRRLGRIEILDQVTAVRYLTVRGIVDPTRVGIYGWSYGGYLAAMCLCRAPDVFHVAVAGAPVTSWDGYDTHYTERYMGLPSDNPNGYRESAIFHHVSNIKGHLMIVHGLIDENVHFRHTSRLINHLIAASKDYDLLLFPDERHSPKRIRDRIYMEQRISNYFVKYLINNTNTKDRTPPTNSARI